MYFWACFVIKIWDQNNLLQKLKTATLSLFEGFPGRFTFAQTFLWKYIFKARNFFKKAQRLI